MNHGSLFSGIGGFDLAAEWMGWENIFNCEIERFPREVLNYYWPNAVSYEDITKTDFTIWRGKIDILTGGFPCQPFSTAGKRKGTEDNRYLWPEMLRAIREIQPLYIVGENVLGFINWNGGLVFKQVLSDLEDEGYEVIPIVFPACGKNAPHRRERIWFVAYSKKFKGNDSSIKTSEKWKESREIGICNSRKTTTNSISKRQWEEDNRIRSTRFVNQTSQKDDWKNFPTQPPVCSGDDGISSRLDIETILETKKRKVNKKFNPFSWWRKESIKAYGNAIVPQVAFEIFKVIQCIEKKLSV